MGMALKPIGTFAITEGQINSSLTQSLQNATLLHFHVRVMTSLSKVNASPVQMERNVEGWDTIQTRPKAGEAFICKPGMRSHFVVKQVLHFSLSKT